MPKYLTIQDIKNASKGHFFDKEAMKFFGSKVYDEVYGGRYFLTSERDSGELAAWNGQRRYTVRGIDDNGNIFTVGEFGEYDTLDKARKAAKEVTA